MSFSFASFASFASSENSSLAWSMGNGGRGRLLIEFPFALDSGWYKELLCTAFRTFQHRKERSGLKHEFIVLQLLDGSVCRIERMGDPNARFDALSSEGSVAYDMAQCFRPEEMNDACLSTSDVIAEVTLPCTFDILDVLKICRAIHEGAETPIQACLTRLVAHWEDKCLLDNWLCQVYEGVNALASTFQRPEHKPILFRLYSVFCPDQCYADCAVSFLCHFQQEIVHKREDIEGELALCINNLLWHPTIDSGLNQFLEEKGKDIITEIILKQVELALSLLPDPGDALAPRRLGHQLLSLLEQVLNSGSETARVTTSPPSIREPPWRSQKWMKQKLIHQPQPHQECPSELQFSAKPVARIPGANLCQWIMGYFLSLCFCVQIFLSMWGITIVDIQTGAIPCTHIDEELAHILTGLEHLATITRSDLERSTSDLRALIRKQPLIWNDNPWADICSRIRQAISINMLEGVEKHKPTIRFSSNPECSDINISDFQLHILARIKAQAREVEQARLRSAARVEAELRDALMQVWKLIREDDSITKKVSKAPSPSEALLSESSFIPPPMPPMPPPIPLPEALQLPVVPIPPPMPLFEALPTTMATVLPLPMPEEWMNVPVAPVEMGQATPLMRALLGFL